MARQTKILTVKGGFLAQTYRDSGLWGCLRKIFSALKMNLPVWILGRRTNKSVGAYFDLITDDARLFYGDSFHFGYFPNGTETFPEALEAHTDLVAEMAQLHETKYVLDIGCGIGAPAIRIAQKYKSQIVGINISQEQIKQAKAIIVENNLEKQIKVQIGNALELPFGDNSFDAVICLEVAGDICVSEDQKKCFVREMYRVLKPGGCLGFSDLIFKTSPTREEEKTMRMILYHEGGELITDWPALFQDCGFTIIQEKNILSQTMETWKHSNAIYKSRSREVEERYGKKIADLTLKHLALIPKILEKHGAFPVLSLQKPLA